MLTLAGNVGLGIGHMEAKPKVFHNAHYSLLLKRHRRLSPSIAAFHFVHSLLFIREKPTVPLTHYAGVTMQYKRNRHSRSTLLPLVMNSTLVYHKIPGECHPDFD